jgi:anti-sigma factor RsiW
MNTMEERLWNYIDGSCTADEKKAIDILIAQDEAYRRKYDELLALNQEFSKMELDEPSMAFTYNVMEGIRAEHAQQPLKAGIDKRIIKSIAGFFIVSIVLLVIYMVSTTPVGNVSFSGHPAEAIKLPDLKNYFNVHLLEAFFFFDLVLGLFLFDAYLRKRGISKQAN